jgi:hypothetical protein
MSSDARDVEQREIHAPFALAAYFVPLFQCSFGICRSSGRSRIRMSAGALAHSGQHNTAWQGLVSRPFFALTRNNESKISLKSKSLNGHREPVRKF